MAKARSPQYPVIGLKDAVDKVSMVYGRDYQNALPRSVVAEHMGYQSLNGKSLGVLSALGKYGLLEGRGDETRVSDLAVTIIAHPPGNPERVAALQTAAQRPDLFAEIAARFPEGRASDQAIRSYLLTQKFIPSAADAAIRAYRETKQFVDSECAGYDGASETKDEIAMHAHVSGHPAQAASAQSRLEPMPLNASDEDSYQLTFRPRSGLGVQGVLRSAKDADDLIAALNAWKNLLKPVDDVKRPESED